MVPFLRAGHILLLSTIMHNTHAVKYDIHSLSYLMVKQ